MFKTMQPEEYISERVDEYRCWYDKKAVGAKKRFLIFRTTAVMGAVLVPVSANLKLVDGYAVAITTGISLIVSVVVALDSVFHFGDQWRNYRSTEQFLLREKLLFRTGEGRYRELDPSQAFLLFVEQCESQIAAENTATLNAISASVRHPDPPHSKA